MKNQVDADESQNQAHDFENAQPLPEKQMGSQGHDKGRCVDQNDGSCRIRVKHSEINAHGFKAEQHPYHKTVKQPPVLVKKRFLDGQAVKNPQHRGNGRTQKRVEDRGEAKVRDFYRRIIAPPEHGEQHEDEKAFQIQMIYCRALLHNPSVVSSSLVLCDFP